MYDPGFNPGPEKNKPKIPRTLLSQLEKFEYDSYMREIVLCNVKFPKNDCVVIMKEDTLGIRVCVYLTFYFLLMFCYLYFLF